MTEERDEIGEPRPESPQPELPMDARILPFNRRRAMVVAYMRQMGVDVAALPINMGTHLIMPRAELVDAWQTAGQPT